MRYSISISGSTQILLIKIEIIQIFEERFEILSMGYVMLKIFQK